MSKMKMNMPRFVLATVVSLGILGVSVYGASEPGSDSDPLVAKSYVDQQIAYVVSLVSGSSGSGSSSGGTVDSTALAQLQTDVGDLTKFVLDTINENTALKQRVSALESGFAVVEAKKGQTVILSGGSEAILRTGKATALKGENGLMIDASGGVDLTDGANVPLQHILLSSRSDGRGLKITADAFLLIRGTYTIK